MRNSFRFCLWNLGVCFILGWSCGPVRAAEPAQQGSTQIDLFAMGDWGIDSPDRKTVADAMANRADVAHPSAVLLLGDNYYVKLADTKDPKIQEFFERTYDPKRLAIPFYAVLGNHDYAGGDAAVELAYSAAGGTRFTIPSPWYRLDLPKENPVVTLLMLDSDQPLVKPGQWAAETKWLEAELAKPHAPWLVCCAHHNLFSNGNHGDNGVLITTWGPLFKKAGVDFYVCGHEHTLQHLEIQGWPMSFVISGGGGATRKPLLVDIRGPFSKSSMGFADLKFKPTIATVSLVDGTGTVVHAFERTKAGAVRVTLTTPSDAATKHPLRVISGGDDPELKEKPHAVAPATQP